MSQLRKGHTRQILKVPEEWHKKRLDLFLESQLELTRSQIKKLIDKKLVSVEKNPALKAGQKVEKGFLVEVEIPQPEPVELIPKEMELQVLYEDDSIAVINKPPGIPIHPAPGHSQDTLANALIARFPLLSTLGGKERPGIVHRLDKDTSGALIIAKTEEVHRIISEMLKQRRISKVYLCVCHGVPNPLEGRIEAPIGRHPVERKKMAVVPKGRDALTLYRTISVSEPYSLVLARIITGRTHQIRVHMHHIKCPIVGDAVYGKKTSDFINRQALHALYIRFPHPIEEKEVEVFAPIPEDMNNLLNALNFRLKEEKLKELAFQLSSKPI